MMKRNKDLHVMQFFHNIKLKHKFFLTYFVLILIPFSFFYWLSSDKISKVMQDHVSFSADQSFDQTYSFLSYKLYKIIKVSDIIATDKNLTDILAKDIAGYRAPEQVEDMLGLIQFLSSFQDREDIVRVRLYVRDGLIYSDENRNIFNLEDAADTRWFDKLEKYSGKVIAFPYEDLIHSDGDASEVISIARNIKNQNNYQSILAVLRLDIDQQNISEIISKANPTKDSLTYLQNSEGSIVACSDPILLEKYVLEYQPSEDLTANAKFAEVWSNGERFIAKHQIIPDVDWRMVTFIPYSDITKTEESSKLKREILWMILLIGTAAYIIAYYASHSITKRISNLIQKMREVQNGKLDGIIQTQDKDEIGELMENYGYMINRISSLIKEQYEMGKELKSAELRTLQSQINPHFLYNSLDMINWLNQKGRTSEIDMAVKSLAKFYKLSLNKGNDIVTIADEMQHVKSYVNIQNTRFMQKITMTMDVAGDLLDYSIPKITLQPIVENSILHGILEKKSKEGDITIKGRMQEHMICITIEDNGVGIPEGKLIGIGTECISSHKGSGYGVKNINQRIKLRYGETYGLSYKSIYGLGTIVEIWIPAVKINQTIEV